MAIYHMQAKVVSRGSGRSAVAASAYMSCSRMYNDYDGIQHDYTRKQGLIYQEVMLPSMAPLEWNDREQLWNAVEENEKTKDSRLSVNITTITVVILPPMRWIISMWRILMFSPIVHGNLNIRGNRKYGEISLLELRKGRMIWNYNLVLLCPL